MAGIAEAFSSRRSRYISSQMLDPLQLFKPSADSTGITNFVPEFILQSFPGFFPH